MTATATGLSELRIKVLGPLEIHVGGEPRTLTAPMARRALAVLLLDANHLVSVQALVEELWDEEPPRLARKTVQTYIYQLRQALKGSADGDTGERLETGSGGYRLTARPGELDLWEFEQRVNRARAALASGAPEDAARLLREGLALWRGEPFAGLEAGPLLAARIAQIGEARLAALELRIEADLQLGRHQGLVAELRRLTVDHPLDERFTAQLMIAAHRSGQRSTALDAYLRLRQRLVDELGIEPSERLRKLQQDILREVLPPAAKPERRPVPVASAPVVDQLPLETPDFVGREPELVRIAEGGAAVVTLLGPAGVGKTALAVRAARAMAGRFKDGLLYASLHDTADRPRSPEAVLRSLLDGLGVARQRQPEDAEGLAALFRAAARERALLVLLDDAAGAEQVLSLLPGGESCLTVVTSRVRLSLPGARRLTLGPLAAKDAEAFFVRLVGEARVAGHRSALHHVLTRLGGDPLMLRAVGELYAARPMWTLTDLAAGLVDDDRLVAELQDEACAAPSRAHSALDRLSPRLRGAVHRLTEAGPGPFDTERVERVLGLDTWTAQSLVGRLLDRHVLVLSDSAPGGPAMFRVPELIRVGVLARAGHGAEDWADGTGPGRGDTARPRTGGAEAAGAGGLRGEAECSAAPAGIVDAVRAGGGRAGSEGVARAGGGRAGSVDVARAVSGRADAVDVVRAGRLRGEAGCSAALAGSVDAVRAVSGRADAVDVVRAGRLWGEAGGSAALAGPVDVARAEGGRAGSVDVVRAGDGRVHAVDAAPAGGGRADAMEAGVDRPPVLGAGRRGAYGARPHGAVPGPARRRTVRTGSQ
ncbi:BTAD domain-containing putative transcriptional regulator [Streptomyces sp. FZ201]|uniref:AfsR/SARP family transcriptional regulator n=1 Tax=Streptomyces sp. FZ201 TaxID=3057122 RepID=UPI0021C01623|nr:BTAD domain-containing putative transcriptional regulator [Streptomyces sp. FZ201]